MFSLRFLASSCALSLAVLSSATASEVAVSFDSAIATSALGSPGFDASAANTKGSEYWCSAGNHAAGQRVAWTGRLNAAQDVAGITINWAYAPGEVRILTSSDGGNFEEAVAWRSSSRNEVSFSEMLMFDQPHKASAVTVVMRSPRPSGFFGINSIEALVVGGPSMLVVGGPAGSGENCLVAAGSGIALRECIEAIASGDGSEAFELTSNSQLVSSPSGKCVTSAGKGLILQDCAATAEFGAGSSSVRFSSTGHLQVGQSCVTVSARGASLGSCGDAAEGDKVAMVAVPEFDPAPAAALRDSASLLRAAVGRQEKLLSELEAGPCKLALAANVSLELVSYSAALKATDPAQDAINRIDSLFGYDLAAAKALIASSPPAVLAK